MQSRSTASWVGPAAVAGFGAALLAFLSMTTSMVVGVVGSIGRYPEAMLDYAVPAITFAAEHQAVPMLILGVTLFVTCLLLTRRSASVPGAVLAGLIGAVVATVIALVGTFAILLVTDGSDVRARMLAEMLASAGVGVAQVLIVGAPLSVLAAVLLVVWHRSRGLTGPDPVE